MNIPDAYNERQRLEKLITEMAPGWDIWAGGCGMGGFDLSIALPDGTYLVVDGAVGSRDLDWDRYSSDQTQDHISMDLGEYKSLCDSIAAAFYPPQEA